MSQGEIVIVLDELDDVVDILKQAALDLGRARRSKEAKMLVKAHNLIDQVRSDMREG